MAQTLLPLCYILIIYVDISKLPIKHEGFLWICKYSNEGGFLKAEGIHYVMMLRMNYVSCLAIRVVKHEPAIKEKYCQNESIECLFLHTKIW